MINAKNLVKRFDDLTAIDNLSFSIPKGEIFGLLGPNGAGKTTTINILVGYLKPDGGRVEIAGFNDPTNPKVRNSIGNAPQKLALYEKLTALQNLVFFGKMYSMRGKLLQERCDHVLELVGLVDRKDSKVETYSGGMKRRLNLAVALIHDPPVLLLDEPTVGVDPQSRNMIFSFIEQLKKSERTIIYTTHYMEEASRLCDRVAIIDHGKILALGTVEQLITEYGGKSVIEAELSEIPPEDTNFPGKLEDRHLRIDTEKPMEMLAELTQSRLKFSQIRVDRPDLETVFLNLTGRSLRD